MRRRSFTAGALSLAAAPFAARAQQVRPRRVAVMHAIRPAAELKRDGNPLHAAFFEELRRLGWQEGLNLTTEVWSGLGRDDRDAFVREVYASKPDIVFLSGGYPQFVPQLIRESGSVPTVVLGPDPLAAGIVGSLARPGGMITGLSTDGGTEMVGKRLQLLAEILPGARRIVYFGPRYNWEPARSVLESGARQLGVALDGALFEGGAPESEIRRVFGAAEAARPDGILLGVGAESQARARPIAELALAARLPTIGFIRDFVEAGMLASYGPDYFGLFRRAAHYVDRILRGTRPADLPVEQPTKFEMVLNMKTARALGIDIPFLVLAQADEVIE